MREKTRFLTALILATSVALLTACGGSSGGGGGGDGIPYAGIQDAVIVGQSNAENVSIGAYEGGSTGDALEGTFISAVQAGAEVTYPAKSRLKAVTEAIKDALAQVETEAVASEPTVAAFMGTGGTEYGACGGQVTIPTDMMDEANWNLTDPNNPSVSSSITFTGYDDCEGEVMDGTVSFTMTMDVTGQSLGTFDVTFGALTTTTDTDSFTISGSMSMTSTLNTETVSMTMVLRDNNTDKTFKTEDYTVTLTEFDTYFEETISGRFYDHDYGYVDIFTDAPLRTNLYEDWPYEGTLRFEGDDNTWVTLTFDSTGATGVVSDDSTFDYLKPATM